jgi:hypothetical protein
VYARHRLGPKKKRSTPAIRRRPPTVTTRRGRSLTIHLHS